MDIPKRKLRWASEIEGRNKTSEFNNDSPGGFELLRKKKKIKNLNISEKKRKKNKKKKKERKVLPNNFMCQIQ